MLIKFILVIIAVIFLVGGLKKTFKLINSMFILLDPPVSKDIIVAIWALCSSIVFFILA